MGTTFKSAKGMLTSTSGDIHAVDLHVTIQSLAGADGIESETVSKIELLSRDVPDGDYVLEYFYLKPTHRYVQVKHGELILPTAA
jgi:hypothetical protein